MIKENLNPTKKLPEYCPIDWDDEACLYCEYANTPKCPFYEDKLLAEKEKKKIRYSGKYKSSRRGKG